MGKSKAAAFEPICEARGGNIVAEAWMPYNEATDFDSGVGRRAIKPEPDVMFIGGTSESNTLMAKQARKPGFKDGFIILEPTEIDEMVNGGGNIALLKDSIVTMPLTKLRVS